MKILVTGGTGFIGQHLVRALVEMGHRVDVLSRRAVRQPSEDPFRGSRVIVGDLATDEVDRLLPDDTEVVYHLAAVGSPNQCIADPARCFEVNVTGTRRLLETVQRKGVRRFIMTSSASVYGDQAPVPTSEDGPLCPSDPLGASKASAEFLARAYVLCQGLPVTVFRLYTIYGPGSGPHQLIPSLIAQIVQRPPSVSIHGPHPTRDFMHVSDAVRGLVTAVARTSPFELFNLGTGVETSVAELGAMLLELAGRSPAELRIAPPDHRGGGGGHVSRHCADVTRAMTQLGWKPSVRLRDGLSHMVETALAQRGLPMRVLR